MSPALPKRTPLATALIAALLAAMVLAIGSAPASAEEDSESPRKRIQEVDPRRLEIQGKIESPASLFILESGNSLFPDINALEGLLGGRWIPSIDKESHDRSVVAYIEKGEETP